MKPRIYYKVFFLLLLLMTRLSSTNAQYTFSLPAKSGSHSGYAYVEDGKYYRLFYNQYERTTYIEQYVLNTGKLENLITLKGVYSDTFFPISKDKLLLLDTEKGDYVEVIKGEISRRFTIFKKLKTPDSNFFQYFIGMKYNPLYLYKNKLYAVNAVDRSQG